jgi:methylenetetrahydrofolate reductase (NADPH)
MTQFFYDVDDYARMVDELAALGCDRPVVPGVMPFISADGLRRMSAINGTRIPPAVAERLARVEDDPAAVRALGVEVATDLCRRLVAAGAPGIHLYTLNRAASVREIWPALEG